MVAKAIRGGGPAKRDILETVPTLPGSLASFVRPRASFEPAYLETYASGRLEEKVEEALEELRCCRVCPRDCDVDRLNDERAVCKTGRHAQVASAFAHFGEEDCLRGWNGSGTIFFSYCNLRCVFCQNFDISWQGNGREMDATEIASHMLSLQTRGCHNINFVTPEHVAPQVLEAVYEAVQRGLRLPIVYNTSAYDSLRSIELLADVVDIYMPDFKFWDPATARRLVLAENYADHAQEAIRAMHRQVGDLVVDEDGLALRGLLVRHLVMPNALAGTREIMHFLADELSRDTYVNIMDQYSPAGQVVERPLQYSDIGRRVSSEEVGEAVRIAENAGLNRLDSRRRPGDRLRPPVV
jgi:putative pyruvate formate lyase activating enzyme